MSTPARATVMNRRFSYLLLACLIIASASAAPAGDPDESKLAEYRIKSAFLYHFCNYIAWPSGAFVQSDSPLLVGVAGPQNVVAQLRDIVGGRFSGARPIEVRAVEKGDALGGLHVLYVAAPERLASFQTALTADAPLLIVTETEGGLQSGSVINFLIEDDRVRFDIATAHARQRQLDVSAQLLTVARHILDETVAADGP